jgi:hypothetical protein
MGAFFLLFKLLHANKQTNTEQTCSGCARATPGDMSVGETWALLNGHLSAVKGGSESRLVSAAMELLSSAVWDGKDFSMHFEYMTTLYNQCVSRCQ